MKRLIFLASISTLFFSCSWFQDDVCRYFDYSTGSAKLVEDSITPAPLIEKGGFSFIDSTSDYTITYTLQNEYGYVFTKPNLLTVDFPDQGKDNFPSNATSLLDIAQENKESLTLTLTKTFLSQTESYFFDISPRVTIFHPISGEALHHFEGIQLKAAILPPQPKPVMMYTKTLGTSSSPYNTFILCFTVPAKDLRKSGARYSTLSKITVTETVRNKDTSTVQNTPYSFPFTLSASGTLQVSSGATDGAHSLLQEEPSGGIFWSHTGKTFTPTEEEQALYYDTGLVIDQSTADDSQDESATSFWESLRKWIQEQRIKNQSDYTIITSNETWLYTYTVSLENSAGIEMTSSSITLY